MVIQTPHWGCRGASRTLPHSRVPRGPHLPQEVVLAHDVPVPNLHAQHSLSQLPFWQLELQHLIPVREPGFLNHLLGTGTVAEGCLRVPEGA